jgi:hypothetical protein
VILELSDGEESQESQEGQSGRAEEGQGKEEEVSGRSMSTS